MGGHRRRSRRPVRARRVIASLALLAGACLSPAGAQGVNSAEQPPAPAPATAPATPPAPARRAHADELAPVQITGSRADDVQERRNSTAAKIVIGRDEIDRFGDSTLGDVLKRLPGVTIQGRPGRGGAIRLRGLGNGYTQILLDGERVPPGFSLDSLSPDQIERIEILRAPTAETGARAIAGTINIVTREGYSKRVNDLRLIAAWENQALQPSVAWTRNFVAGAWTINYSLTAFAPGPRQQQHDDHAGPPARRRQRAARPGRRRHGARAPARPARDRPPPVARRRRRRPDQPHADPRLRPRHDPSRRPARRRPAPTRCRHAIPRRTTRARPRAAAATRSPASTRNGTGASRPAAGSRRASASARPTSRSAAFAPRPRTVPSRAPSQDSGASRDTSIVDEHQADDAALRRPQLRRRRRVRAQPPERFAPSARERPAGRQRLRRRRCRRSALRYAALCAGRVERDAELGGPRRPALGGDRDAGQRGRGRARRSQPQQRLDAAPARGLEARSERPRPGAASA